MKKEANICPNCKSKNMGKIIISGLYPQYKIKSDKLYSYIQCKKCKIVYIFPFTKIKALKEKVYNKNYFQSPKISRLQKIIYSFYLYKGYRQWVNDNSRKGKLLDFGCGTADFLLEMKNDGWDVFGTEVNSYLVSFAQKKIGKDRIFYQSGNSFNKISNDFSVITLWHVLEHLENPSVTLSNIQKHLKKGGKIFIEVPNVDSLVFKIFGKNYTWLRIPDHLFYFSPDTLYKTLKQAGFHSIKIICPVKSNLNLSLNISSYFSSKVSSNAAKIITILSIPFSILISILASFFGRSEIIRAEATK